MDQSGSRHTTLKPPLIERPDLQSPRQRTLYGALTLVFWGFWFYLWLPLLALLAWSLGVQQAFKYMVVLAGYQEVARLIGIYCLVILLLGGGLVAWAVYNIIRFRGVERRGVAAPISAAQYGRAFGHDAQQIERWQGAQCLAVTHDAQGRIARVDIMVAGEPSVV
jgi:biofilm PGA synthesis protein PgaD